MHLHWITHSFTLAIAIPAIAISSVALPSSAQSIPVQLPVTADGPNALLYPGEFPLPAPPSTTEAVTVAVAPPAPELWQHRTLWQRVALPNTGFQVLMPNQPRHVSEGRSDQPMLTQQFVSASDPGHDALYMVGWRDNLSTADAEGQALLFEAERNALLQGFAGELLHETNVQFQGNPGKHYRILGALDGEPLIITHRAYVLNNRLFQLTVAVPLEREPGFIGMAEGFMQSFQPL